MPRDAEYGISKLGYEETIRDLKIRTMRIDLASFVESLVSEFLNNLNHELNLKAAVDDTWIHELILGSTEVEPIEDKNVKEAVALMVLKKYEGGQNAIALIVGTSGGYELRAVITSRGSGIALVSEGDYILGERVLKEFGNLRVEGELYCNCPED